MDKKSIDNSGIELLIGVVLTIFSLIFYFIIIPSQVVKSVEKDFSSLYFPKAAAIVMICISLTIILQGLSQYKKDRKNSKQKAVNKEGLFRFLGAITIIVAGYYSINYLGYIIVTGLSIIGWMALFREFNWKRILAITILTTVICYYFFTSVMGVYLPGGILSILLD